MAAPDIHVEMVPVGDVFITGSRRDADADAVARLANSIKEIGLQTPITVRVDQGITDPDTGEIISGYALVAGRHRLEATRSIGASHIAAIVRDCSELDAELWEIDENLCRAELSPSDRARQTARRKAIYEEMHGPAKASGARAANAAMGRGDANEKSALAFTAATAAVTGQSERAVQLNAERGQKILPEVLDMIRGTKLDTGTYMDKLKSMPGSDQFKAAQRDLLHLRHQERVAMQARTKIKVADAPLNDEAAQERQVAALMSAWNKASAEARQEFLDRIDTPVMDRAAQ